MPASFQQPTTPIRIGFISAHFRRHIISQVTKGILEHLPRDTYEVVAIHLLEDPTQPTIVAPFADRTVRVESRDLHEVRLAVAQLELDVLVYADIGMDAFSYLLAFSRLADVQCVLAGHPVTTGIAAIDYYVSTALFEPANAPEHYAEKLICLENISVHFPRYPKSAAILPNIRGRLGIAPNTRIYTCPLTLFKLHPDYDGVIIRILEEDPDSVFVHMDGTEPHFALAFRHRITQRAPALAARILTCPMLPFHEFLGFLLEVDACLDSFYFGAGTTALFALGVGVPIITLPSPYMRGRVTYGAYLAMGIQDAVATDVDDYVAKALRLAQDPAWRRDLGERLLERSDVLFDQLDSVKELADFFARALAAKRAGAPLIDWPPERSNAT